MGGGGRFRECWAVKQLSESGALTKMDATAAQDGVRGPGRAGAGLFPGRRCVRRRLLEPGGPRWILYVPAK